MNKPNNERDKMIRDLKIANTGLNQHCDILAGQIRDLQLTNNALLAENNKLVAENKNLVRSANIYYELYNQHKQLEIQYGQLQNHCLVLSRNLESIKQDYYTVDARYENLKSLVLKVLELWDVDNGKKYLKEFEQKFENVNTFIKECKLFQKIAVFLQD